MDEPTRAERALPAAGRVLSDGATERLRAWSTAELEAELARHGGEGSAEEPTWAAAVHRARLARLLYVREPERFGAESPESELTRRLLAAATEGGEDEAVPPSDSARCVVWLERARFAAVVAEDMNDAVSAADAAVDAVRGVSEASARACGREAQRLAESWRAGRGSGDEEGVAREEPSDPGEAGEEATRLDAISVYQGGDSGARVVLRLSRPMEVGLASEGTEESSRAWVDLDGVIAFPTMPREWPVGAGGLRRVRRVSREDAGERVLLELEPGADAQLFVLPEPFRVVVDVAPARPEVAGVGGDAHPVRVIVLDPGHGGREFGARARGLRESHVALDLALRVATMLQHALPGVRVVLTRRSDETVSLEERTALANAVGAGLFVSIHLNAADEPVQRGGVTTFVLDTANERQALRLAARENGTATWEVTGFQRFLAGLHRREQVAASRELAMAVHEGTLRGGRRVLPHLADRGVRSAMFHVLVGARMPAVLLEASFLSKPDEAAALATPAYRQALAEGIAAGIQRYVVGR